MTISTGIMRPSDIGLEGEEVSFIRSWTWREVERVMRWACAGQGVDVRHLGAGRVEGGHRCRLTLAVNEDDHGDLAANEIAAAEWVARRLAAYLCAVLGVSYYQEGVRSSSHRRAVYFTIPDHTIEPITYLDHVPGRQCEGECPLCVRLELGFVVPEAVSYAMALFEDGASGKVFGEPGYPDGWHDRIFSKAGDMEVYTVPRFPVFDVPSMKHVDASVVIYCTSVFVSSGHDYALASEWCWTQAEARKQHARWLVAVAEGRVG